MCVYVGGIWSVRLNINFYEFDADILLQELSVRHSTDHNYCCECAVFSLGLTKFTLFETVYVILLKLIFIRCNRTNKDKDVYRTF